MHRGDKVFFDQRALIVVNVEIELLVDLITTNTREVVLLRIEEQPLQERIRVCNRWRIARTETLVDFFKRFFPIICRIFLPEILMRF